MSSRRLAEPDSPSDTMTSVRIYIPATSADVSKEDLLPRLVHAVTRELEHAMPAEGEEVLESVAMGAAADDSLRILTALAQGGETIRPLRVVVVADVADSRVEPVSGDDLLPTSMTMRPSRTCSRRSEATSRPSNASPMKTSCGTTLRSARTSSRISAEAAGGLKGRREEPVS